MTVSVWVTLLLALLAANVPFMTERIFLLGPKRSPKPKVWRVVELLLLWGLTLGLGMALEARIGQRHVQGWEFYAAFGFLFLTFAFPGFIWRYLRKSRLATKELDEPVPELPPRHERRE